MGAPGGGLKQCAQGRGQDRTSVGSPHMPKATFPFVTARQWVDGWRLFFLNTATVSAGHSQPWPTAVWWQMGAPAAAVRVDTVVAS